MYGWKEYLGGLCGVSRASIDKTRQRAEQLKVYLAQKWKVDSVPFLSAATS